jgi:putative DNA methylase
MVTFRLADSLPAQVLEELRSIPGTPRGAERRKRAEAYLDAGYGACYLRTPAIARIVEDALLRFDGARYRLLAWSIMPNHVHVLVELPPRQALAKVLHSWKSFTGHAANRLLSRSGPFWQIEYWDRYIRDPQHFENAIRYINGNRSPFSSAARKREGKGK